MGILGWCESGGGVRDARRLGGGVRVYDAGVTRAEECETLGIIGGV